MLGLPLIFLLFLGRLIDRGNARGKGINPPNDEGLRFSILKEYEVLPRKEEFLNEYDDEAFFDDPYGKTEYYPEMHLEDYGRPPKNREVMPYYPVPRPPPVPPLPILPLMKFPSAKEIGKGMDKVIQDLNSFMGRQRNNDLDSQPGVVVNVYVHASNASMVTGPTDCPPDSKGDMAEPKKPAPPPPKKPIAKRPVKKPVKDEDSAEKRVATITVKPPTKVTPKPAAKKEETENRKILSFVPDEVKKGFKRSLFKKRTKENRALKKTKSVRPRVRTRKHKVLPKKRVTVLPKKRVTVLPKKRVTVLPKKRVTVLPKKRVTVKKNIKKVKKAPLRKRVMSKKVKKSNGKRSTKKNLKQTTPIKSTPSPL